ncbi:hypothetical protein HG535_0G04500 [Zygotorulaspora mrakii]|uniref:Bud site selection protein RAX2 n=1 Tax=Zygotorulaspora mrakii TaxID=42260 RepID=A0A7H9B7I4_ZYGMR|nr:uncharacterized protein HG535_0G04500 [Zygotorulaspora mrakii]QLG74567.1 hypothetical protein HG535_0G04500 [Zygotorulaspora mrakii]
MIFIWLLHLLVLVVKVSYSAQLQNIRDRLNIQYNNIPPLQLSNNSNNVLEVLGDFKTLSILRYTGQENFTSGIASNSSPRDLIYYSNDTFVKLLRGNDDTCINQIVPFGVDSFILSGTGSLSELSLENQLLFNLTSGSLNPIFETRLLNINAILEDGDSVYFGGNFTFTNTQNSSLIGHSVSMWNSTGNYTSLLPFVGFGEGSVVNSIIRLDTDNILFSGRFHELENTALLIKNHSATANTSFSSNSSSYLPSIHLGQVVPLKHSNWTSQDGILDEDSFVCPNSNADSWFLNGTAGSLECALPHSLVPKKIRIYNSQIEDHQVSLFRIITRPSNGIMNLTYLDPIDGTQKFCDAFCPLMSKRISTESTRNLTRQIFIDNNLTDIGWSDTFQDFAFVDDILVAEIELQALSSYGSHLGLSSFQIYQETLSTFANNSLNVPDCEFESNYSNAELSNNTWYSNSQGTGSIAAEYAGGSDTIPRVSFYPDIIYAGNYTINIYTPGCSLDNTCSSRGIANVTLWNQTDSSILSSILLYQNNEELKYDTVFSGHLDSSPLITLEYHSSVYPNNPSTVFVADFVDVSVNSVDDLNNNFSDSSKILLNGLFQYQKSNFTNGATNISVGNTTLNKYPNENLPNNSSLYACMYNESVWIGGSNSGVVKLELDDGMAITEEDRIGTSGHVEKISVYSEGIIIFETFNQSSEVRIRTYNRANNSFENLNSSFTTFSNVTFHGSELLIFDNHNIFNVSSQQYVSNSSSFSLSLWAAGQNSHGDLIFSGAVSENEYSKLNGSVALFGSNSSLTTSSISESAYRGIFLNNSLSAYAIHDKEDFRTRMVFTDGRSSPWTWAGSIDSMLYSSNETLLAVGSSGVSQNSFLTLFNLSNFETIANETLLDGRINSMVFFERNSTFLVGGNFTLSNSNCSNLCLYSYEKQSWQGFETDFVVRDVKQLQLNNSTEILLSASWSGNKTSNSGLASLKISDFTMRSLLNASNDLRFSSSDQNSIIAWNSTHLMSYDLNDWRRTRLPTSLPIVDLTQISINGQLDKRDNEDLQGILVIGRSLKSAENNVQAFLYDSQSFLPYFSANLNSDTYDASSFFADEDVSSLYVTDQLLLNPNRTLQHPRASSTSYIPSSSPTSTSTSSHRSRKRLDRGFVVLIGLALAVGTVTLIGITGVSLAFLFKQNETPGSRYSKTSEADMTSALPAEKLLKFL